MLISLDISLPATYKHWEKNKDNQWIGKMDRVKKLKPGDQLVGYSKGLKIMKH